MKLLVTKGIATRSKDATRGNAFRNRFASLGPHERESFWIHRLLYTKEGGIVVEQLVHHKATSK